METNDQEKFQTNDHPLGRLDGNEIETSAGLDDIVGDVIDSVADVLDSLF